MASSWWCQEVYRALAPQLISLSCSEWDALNPDCGAESEKEIELNIDKTERNA